MRSGLASKIKSLLVPAGRRPYRIPFGLYRGITLDFDLASSFQIYIGLWELETHRYFDCWNDYGWAIDVGAGAGELCLLFLKRCPNIEKIFAIDADGGEAERLQTNLRLNPEFDTGKIVSLQRRVGVDAGDLRLDELPLGKAPGFLKIDVDGYELAVLEGARGLLERRNIDILLETHSTDLEVRSIAALGALGYQTHIIPNGWYRRIVPEQRPSNHNRWLWATKRA